MIIIDYYKLVCNRSCVGLVNIKQAFTIANACCCGKSDWNQVADLEVTYSIDVERDVISVFGDMPLVSKRFVDLCAKNSFSGITFRPTSVSADTPADFALLHKPYYQIAVLYSFGAVHPRTKLTRDRYWCKRCQRGSKHFVLDTDTIYLSSNNISNVDFATVPDTWGMIVSQRVKDAIESSDIKGVIFNKCEVI